MERLILTILSLIPFFQLTGQTKKLEQYKELKTTYFDTDSNRVHILESIKDVTIVTNAREFEYFVQGDTSKRDYIQISNSHKLILDQVIGISDKNYTIAYDLITCYLIEKQGFKYVVLVGGDTFPMGTNQDVDFIVLKFEGEKFLYYNSFSNEADKPTDNIKVICSKKSLKLKGKYLKQIKRQGLNCLN